MKIRMQAPKRTPKAATVRRNSDNGDEGDTYGGDQQEERAASSMPTASSRSGADSSSVRKTLGHGYRIEARVTDAGNREIAGHGSALATYGSFHLDAPLPTSYVYSRATPRTINVARAGLRQEARPDRLRVEMVAGTGGPELQDQVVRTSQGADGRHGNGAIQSHDSERRRTSACASRDHSRKPRRRVTRHLPVGAWAYESVGADAEGRSIQIVADKKSYKPGETAHVLIVTGK